MRFRCDLDSIYGLSAVATVYAAVATVYAAVATVYAAVMTISRLWFRCGFGVVEAHLNRTETGMKPDLNHTAPPSGHCLALSRQQSKWSRHPRRAGFASWCQSGKNQLGEQDPIGDSTVCSKKKAMQNIHFIVLHQIPIRTRRQQTTRVNRGCLSVWRLLSLEGVSPLHATKL